jgi:hypothetical protein
MNYKIMNRPMFKMGGSTTPRRNYSNGSYNLFGDEGLLSQRDKLYKDLTDQLEKSKSNMAYQALAGVDFSAIDKPSDILGALGENKDRFIKGLMNQKSVDLKSKKMNLDKIGTDINVGLALRKQDSKTYEFKERMKMVDENNKLIDAILAKDPNLENQSNATLYGQLEDKNAALLRKMSEDEFVLKGLLQNEDADAMDLRDRYRSARSRISKKNKAEGGRVDRQMGTPMMGEQPMQPETQMSEQSMQPEGQQDPYQYLRTRLPAEIPDQVVKLIAYNKEAFNDFAAIETQDDLDSFNKRYNVELVVNV